MFYKNELIKPSPPPSGADVAVGINSSTCGCFIIFLTPSECFSDGAAGVRSAGLSFLAEREVKVPLSVDDALDLMHTRGLRPSVLNRARHGPTGLLLFQVPSLQVLPNSCGARRPPLGLHPPPLSPNSGTSGHVGFAPVHLPHFLPRSLHEPSCSFFGPSSVPG